MNIKWIVYLEQVGDGSHFVFCFVVVDVCLFGLLVSEWVERCGHVMFGVLGLSWLSEACFVLVSVSFNHALFVSVCVRVRLGFDWQLVVIFNLFQALENKGGFF